MKMNEKNLHASWEFNHETKTGENSHEEKNITLLKTGIDLSREQNEINSTNAEIASAALEEQINSFRDWIDNELASN